MNHTDKTRADDVVSTGLFHFIRKYHVFHNNGFERSTCFSKLCGKERHFAGLSYARQSYMGAYAFLITRLYRVYCNR